MGRSDEVIWIKASLPCEGAYCIKIMSKRLAAQHKLLALVKADGLGDSRHFYAVST